MCGNPFSPKNIRTRLLFPGSVSTSLGFAKVRSQQNCQMDEGRKQRLIKRKNEQHSLWNSHFFFTLPPVFTIKTIFGVRIVFAGNSFQDPQAVQQASRTRNMEPSRNADEKNVDLGMLVWFGVDLGLHCFLKPTCSSSAFDVWHESNSQCDHIHLLVFLPADQRVNEKKKWFY